MTIKLSVGTSPSEVEKIQSRYNVVFSNEYYEFLVKNNGMFLGDGAYCTMPFYKVDDGEIAFLELYGIGTINKNLDLDNANVIIDEIKALKNPFVIGADPGGNIFLINGDENDVSIYYWDREHIHFDSNPDYPEYEEEGDIYKFSDSFSEFYERIISYSGGNKTLLKEKL